MTLAARLVLVGLILPLAAAVAPAGAQDALPPGCEAQRAYYLCRWTFSDAERATADAANATATSRDFQLPVHPSTLATILVRRTGADDGWAFRIEEVVRDGDAVRTSNVSASQHAQQADASARHDEKTTHLVFAAPLAEYWLRFSPGNAQVRQAAVLLPTGAPGQYEITYSAQALPEGVAPSRPAATADDPHMLDLVGDVDAPDHDLVAAWLDDARVGDGLMDVHLQVRDLASVTFASGLQMAPGVTSDATKVDWKVTFSVRGKPYYVAWEATPGEGAGGESFTCALRRESATDTETEELLAQPACVQDRGTGTFHATFPTQSIGSPADGEMFQDITARVRVFEQGGFTTVVDDDPELRYAFALGGPEVWHALNPRLTPASQQASLPWYEAPLASENIPDTLQVVGAVLAALTFVGGLIVVWRGRRATRALLARVEHVEQQHEHDTRRALIELGRLEGEITRAFRAGRIREAQYQVASQRISSVAARFALRRDLGLDDGTPDDPEAAVRVPVQDHKRPDQRL